MMDFGTRYIRATALALVLLAPEAPAAAAGSSSGVGTYGAPFLGIPVGARLMTSPIGVAGTAPDASLAFSNPAFLSDLRSTSQYFISTANWLDDLRLVAASGAFRPGRGRLSLSTGIQMLYSGSIQGYNANLEVVDQSAAYDLGLTGSAAWRFGRLAVSVSSRYIREHLVSDNGTGVTLGAGAVWKSSGYVIHASAGDVAGSVRFSDRDVPVDSRYLVGIARRVNLGLGSMAAGVDLSANQAGVHRVLAGVEYQPLHAVAIRVASPDMLGPSPSRGGLRGGLGFTFGAMHLDYAYTSRDFFGASHTFSIVYTPRRGAMAGAAIIPTRRPVNDTAPEQFPSQPNRHPKSAKSPKAGAIGTGLVWIVFAGSYNSRAVAEDRRMTLERAGVPCEIDERESGGFRVVVGRFARRADAEALAARYHAFGRFGVIAQRAR